MNASLRKQMHPLWILFTSRWGGAEQIAVSDMVDLARGGMKVSLLCLEASPLHAAALRYPEIDVHTVPSAVKNFDFSFVRELRSMILEIGANILHIKNQNLLWSIVPALLGHREISVVASRHALVSSRLDKWLQAPLYARLDYLMVLSETVRASVHSRMPVPDKKIKVINLGLDFSRFDPAKVDGRTKRTEWGADKDTIVVGSVGRLDPEIGQDTFIKAAAGLMKFKDRKMKFVIVGEDPLVASDAYLEELKTLTELFHMQDYITFAQLGDDLPEIMAGFDIFVMPGSEEVPGLGALEALAMERPVVLSRVAGAEDIVGNQEFGLLVRPDDAFDLQQKILMLLENPSVRLSMGVNGRKYVLKHFDKRIRFLRTIEVYEKCMKRRFSGSKDFLENSL